jgi:shikimate kinase
VGNAIIYLVGVKHSGKSSLGRLLARHLGRPFIDTDSLIQDIDSAETSMRRPVRDIYGEDGRQRFIELERTAMELTGARNDSPVVSTGGGLCDNQPAVAVMNQGIVVHLTDTVERLVSRILGSGMPAFLKSTNRDAAHRELRELLERRKRAYSEIADVTVDLQGLPIPRALEVLIRTIEEIEVGRK